MDNLTQLNLTVNAYHKRKNIENFRKIINILEPCMVRGSANKENFGEGSVLRQGSICDIALTISGYKPLCIADNYDIQDFILLNYDIKTIPLPKRQECVLWIDDDQYHNAIALSKLIKNTIINEGKKYTNTELKFYYQSMGKLLGYPQADIDYFVNKKS